MGNQPIEKTGVPFESPIIADIYRSVYKRHGMLQPGESETAAVQLSSLIDP